MLKAITARTVLLGAKLACAGGNMCGEDAACYKMAAIAATAGRLAMT